MGTEEDFPVLSDEKFGRLTTDERLKYLKQAIMAMERLTRQIRTALALPDKPDEKNF